SVRGGALHKKRPPIDHRSDVGDGHQQEAVMIKQSKKAPAAAARISLSSMAVERAPSPLLRKQLVLALAGACSAIGGGQAWAQTAGEGTALPEITVSTQTDSALKKTGTAGSRIELTPLETPASVSVMSG